ncbi:MULTISPECIES: hypothetical protein [unclassified Pseudomonas]|uniref:hypothetical protein n=1 Tax=unclassified Pseudomonas TaxID=196821 RepID=UPI001474A301|nr:MULTISPECIES: hypothetical protein [unclassified Pseudomonas]MBK3456666.1 hypothetical protein [Pseudomonas sp. MF6754]NMX35767.1 hypothetical protein [Pseudomonas sp. WS 5413]
MTRHTLNYLELKDSMTSNLIKEAEFEAVGQRGKTYTITQVLEDKNLYESKSRTYKRVNELTSYWVKGGGAAKIIDANRFFIVSLGETVFRIN